MNQQHFGGDMGKYYVFTNSVFGKRQFIDSKDIAIDLITDDFTNEKTEGYVSIYSYPESVKNKYESQIKKYSQTKDEKDKPTLAGVTDGVANHIVFDFDNKDNIKKAKVDTKELIARLLEIGVPKESINLFFSGNKGFSVEFFLDQDISQELYKHIVLKLGEGLETFDKSIYDLQRIFRVWGSLNPKTGLYKTKLKIEELELSVDDIKKKAKKQQTIRYKSTSVPFSVFHNIMNDYNKKEEKPKVVSNSNLDDIEWDKKPNFLSNCKYAMLNGFFESGNRHYAVMALISTFKQNGFPKEAIKGMIDGVVEKQASIYNADLFPEEEIITCINSVYNDTWQGGTYTCKDEGQLKDYCNKLGIHSCSNSDKDLQRELISISDLLKQYVKSVKEDDGLGVPIGLPSIDRELTLKRGTVMGLVGAPGSGKSTLLFKMAEYNSKKGNKGMIYSLDMPESITSSKLVQLKNEDPEQFERDIRSDSQRTLDVLKQIEEDYKNIHFNFDTGIQVEDIYHDIKKFKQHYGENPKFIIIDYFECLSSTRRDMHESHTEIIQKLKKLANKQNVLIILLVQPNKISGDLSTPIKSAYSIKGPQALVAEPRTIISVHREGATVDNENEENDKYITLRVLKSTFTKLKNYDFHWDGKNGIIRELSYAEKMELKELREDNEREETNGFD